MEVDATIPHDGEGLISTQVSSMAHSEVMRYARPGLMEYQLESLFMHHTYTHGLLNHGRVVNLQL